MSRSCQSATFFQCRRHIGTDHACEADQVLRQHRVALVRHGGRALLPLREILLRLQNFGALQMADFGRQPFDRGGNDAERGEIHGVAITRDDLGRNRLDPQSHLLRHISLDARIDLRERADGARDRAGCHLAARRRQARLGACELRISIGELQPKRRRLGMNAVRAADGRRELVFECAALERGVEFFHVGDEEVGGANELDVEAGVEHIRRRHALVHETRFRPDDFGQMGEKGDHIMLGLALDFLDARDVELGVLGLGPDFRRRGLRDDPKPGHGVGGVRLDLKPDAKARFRRPDRRHFRPGVARDHRWLSAAAMPCLFGRPTSARFGGMGG